MLSIWTYSTGGNLSCAYKSTYLSLHAVNMHCVVHTLNWWSNQTVISIVRLLSLGRSLQSTAIIVQAIYFSNMGVQGVSFRHGFGFEYDVRNVSFYLGPSHLLWCSGMCQDTFLPFVNVLCTFHAPACMSIQLCYSNYFSACLYKVLPLQHYMLVQKFLLAISLH